MSEVIWVRADELAALGSAYFQRRYALLFHSLLNLTKTKLIKNFVS